jgi:hypothetical protein
VGPGLIPRPVVTVIAAVVIAVWALAQAAVIFVPGYQTPAEIHLAAMFVLGALFGLRKDDNQPDEQRDDKPTPPTPPPDKPPPQGRVSATDLIARLEQERRRDRR